MGLFLLQVQMKKEIFSRFISNILKNKLFCCRFVEITSIFYENGIDSSLYFHKIGVDWSILNLYKKFVFKNGI